MAAGRKKLPIHLILVLRPSIHASHHERLSVSMRACIHYPPNPIPSHPNCHSATDDETTPHPIMLVEQWSEMRTAAATAPIDSLIRQMIALRGWAKSAIAQFGIRLLCIGRIGGRLWRKLAPAKVNNPSLSLCPPQGGQFGTRR